MGKAQKKRAIRRHNPVRVPDSHLPKGLEAAAASSKRKDEVLPIIQKLEGVEAQDRTWACAAVSNLIQNDPSTRRLLQGKNIVGVLINRLSDNVDEVVVEAAGALRNLCIDGGHELCAEMYNKGVLSPLKSFIPKISSALHELIISPKSAPENAAELVYGLAENVITLLWCLSETSNKALNSINEIQLVPFLMAFLENRQKLPSKIVAAAAQCLYVLTEDNDPAIEEVRSNSTYTSCLLGASQPPLVSVEERDLSIRLLSAGILRNISPVPAPSAASAVDIDRTVVLPLLLPELESVSLPDASAKVLEIISSENEEPVIDKPSLKHTPKSDHKSPKELELERIEAKLRNVQLSLEILTGVCATLPDPEPDQNGEADADATYDDLDEDEASEKEDNDVEMNSEQQVDAPESNGVDNTAQSYLSSLVLPLLSLTHPTPLSFPTVSPAIPPGSAAPLEPPFPAHPPTTSALGAIHVSALECLNNLFLPRALAAASAASTSGSNAKDAEGGQRVWNAIWASLALVGLEGGRGQEKRREIWEAAAGVLWGVATIWKGCLIADTAQVSVLMQICDAATDEQLKVKCIGALEGIAQKPDAIEVNKVIAEYLLRLIGTQQTTPGSATSAEPLLQAASAIIDIYSDETLPYDFNFRSGAFTEALTSSVDNVRRAVRSIDRKKDGGRILRARGEEILGNLKGFIAYRRSLRL